MATSMDFRSAALAVALAAAVAALAAPSAVAHPTVYPERRAAVAAGNASCVDPPAEILSYHIHLLFWGNSKTSTAGALAIRDAFIEQFDLKDEKPCTGLFHQGRLCMESVDMQAAGPFPVAQWSAFILPENFSATVPWIMQNRGEYSALVHPNSGCEVEDHTVWPLWGGPSWGIDASAFSEDCPGCTPWSDDQ